MAEKEASPSPDRYISGHLFGGQIHVRSPAEDA